MGCGVGCRCGSGPVLLWLWCRLAAAATVQPLAQEVLYAAGLAIRRQINKVDKLLVTLTKKIERMQITNGRNDKEDIIKDLMDIKKKE